MSGKSPKQDAKYDNVKVKVWLDGTHHYVLSRRDATVCGQVWVPC